MWATQHEEIATVDRSVGCAFGLWVVARVVGCVCSLFVVEVAVGGKDRTEVEKEGGSRVGMVDLAENMGLVVVGMAGSHLCTGKVVGSIAAVWMGW
jgi:hypothetical protein